MADDTFTVERSATIDAPPERVYEQIADFHRWTAWSPWEGLDPELHRTYSGAEAGVGAVYEWSGNRKAGQGRMEMIEAVPPRTVRIALAFEKPFKAHNDTTFIIEPQGPGSLVSWSMTGTKTFMTRLMAIFMPMEKLLGPEFDKGLANLNRVCTRPRP